MLRVRSFLLLNNCLTRNKKFLLTLKCQHSSGTSNPGNFSSPFVSRDDESITDKRARLLYQSRKRGMLENGLLLSTFAAKYLNSFNDQQLNLYDQLINLPSNDWDLYYWVTGVTKIPPEFNNEVMELFKRHVQNELKETRFQQPDLH